MTDYESAIADYKRVIELDAEFENAFFNRGLAFAAKGDYQQAISDFTQVTQLSPEDVGAYYERGVVYGRMANYEKAAYDFELCLQLDSQANQCHEALQAIEEIEAENK